MSLGLLYLACWWFSVHHCQICLLTTQMNTSPETARFFLCLALNENSCPESRILRVCVNVACLLSIRHEKWCYKAWMMSYTTYNPYYSDWWEWLVVRTQEGTYEAVPRFRNPDTNTQMPAIITQQKLAKILSNQTSDNVPSHLASVLYTEPCLEHLCFFFGGGKGGGWILVGGT